MENAILVRYKGGFVEVTNTSSISTWDRQEGFVSLGDVKESTDASSYGTNLLTYIAQPEYPITAELAPASTTDQPYNGFALADVVSAPDEDGVAADYRVVGLTVDENVDGMLRWVPELRTLSDELEERYNRWLSRATQGLARGKLTSVSPQRDESTGVPTGVLPVINLPPWSHPSEVTVSESPRYFPESRIRVCRMTVTATSFGTGTTTVKLRRNNTAFYTIDLGSTEAFESARIWNEFADTTDHLTVEVTAAGAHENVTVQVVATSSI
jgi:hypothetical protein